MSRRYSLLLARAVTRCVLFALALFSFAAFAQVALDGGLDGSAPGVVTPIVGDTGFTVAGIFMVAGVVLGFALIALLVFVLARYVEPKRGQGAGWDLAARLSGFATLAVSKAESLKPTLTNVLADGKITPEEAALLKAEAIKVFKSLAGDALEQAPAIIGFDKAALPDFIESMIEKAVIGLKGATTTKVVNVAASSTIPAPDATPTVGRPAVP